MIFSNSALARRLERAEALANQDFVEASAVVFPARGAAWVELGGTVALFDGASSPITQTFGLGMHEPLNGEILDAIEAFFHEHGAAACHEVSPLTDGSVWPLLHARRYEVVEFTNVLWRPIDRALRIGRAGDVTARPIRESEHQRWAATAARGWSHLPELTEFMDGLAAVNPKRRRHVSFVAEKDGEAIAAGGVCLCDGVGLLSGASTIPEARNQGAQGALLEARLRHAAEQGCDLAMMGAQPGSGSQRNAERQGFRIAYTRIKWRAAAPADR